MRDPKRIGPLLERLRRVWEANPDYRLGQMVANVTDDDTIYRVEDDVLILDIETVHATGEAEQP